MWCQTASWPCNGELDGKVGSGVADRPLHTALVESVPWHLEPSRITWTAEMAATTAYCNQGWILDVESLTIICGA
jgi:hypothetical protein